MVFSDMADRLMRGVDTVQSTVNEAFFEPVIRLGVTGLSGAGKTVFITSLVANLIDRARMVQLLPAANGAIRAAYLRPQPDDIVARFDYETHLGALLSATPAWPQSTRAISELRLSLRVQPTGILGAISGPKTVHIDIVDYPGEWLLDLALWGKSYSQWSADTLDRLDGRSIAADYLAQTGATDAAALFEESAARSLAQGYAAYLASAKAAGYSDCTPGRFLLPGDLAGSPVVTFAPVRKPERPRRGTLWREMERRYEAYKAKVVKPFFRDHFARIDRQIVLVDVLGAIHAGPRAFEDLRRVMAEILGAFRPGRNAILSKLLLGRRVEKILFAATKADHLHHRQHPQLMAIMEALVKDARARADFKGADTAAMSIAALRATVEQTIDHKGAALDCVRGTLASGKQAAFFPGELPSDPAQLLSAARDGAANWLDADYQNMCFAPARLTLKPGEGPPHIRLDRAAQFLIGDRL
ncbi:MAG: YcjX family protein [Paracoccaceae bacterium]